MNISASKTAECLTLRGEVFKIFFAKPSFSAGILRTDDGAFVKFRGAFQAVEGDSIALVGRWVKDPKFGPQFDVERLSYDLPETPDGLVHYLASNPAFKGIGLKTAQKIVNYATNGKELDRLVRGNIAELHKTLHIPISTLEVFRNAWIANSEQNEVRTFLAGFGLTNNQVNTLLETFGSAVVGVLRNDPYVLIKHIDGYGFKRVDQIARKMGVPKNHPGRIAAAIIYCLNEEISSGHTWTAGCDLLDKANDVLILDDLDSRDLIRQSADALMKQGEIMADGTAVTIPRMLEAEGYIRKCLAEHAWQTREVFSQDGHAEGLNSGQIEAFHRSLNAGISVISGGAGTGKTFLIACLVGAFRSAGLKVALCAPTGKAAKRIEEVMRKHGLDLEAATIHRLLRYDGKIFRRESFSESSTSSSDNSCENSDCDSGYDVVICDEVSMVDVPLLSELMKRINFDRTKLILVGDHNQLPPVGPGNVLRDILSGNMTPKTVLTEVVRQAGILKVNSAKILSGTIAPSAVNDSAWSVVDSFREQFQIQGYIRDLIRHFIPKHHGFNPIRDVQIVTPTHKGPLGTKVLNEMMQFLLHGKVDGHFAVGDKVIQTVNDYDLGVMNGTIGYITEIDEDELLVEFDGGHVHMIDRERRRNIQLAYALTAHKCQGSEFPCVVVICHKSHFFADRNWLYTAATRASKTCIIVGDKWGLHHAAQKNNTIKRRTFLNLWAGQASQNNKCDLQKEAQ